MKQVIGYGALNVDNIFKVDNLLLEQNPAYPIDVQAGGSAANTIAALSKLGITCGFVGIVANDAYGRLLISEFKRRKIDTRQIIIRHAQEVSSISSLVEVYVDRQGRRLMFIKPGVTNSLKQNEINLSYLKNSEIVHLSSFVDDAQFKIQRSIVQKLPKAVKISFSPSSLYCTRGLSELKQFINKAYIVFLNKSESYQLTGKNYLNSTQQLLKMGTQIVVTTLGKKGCFVATSNQKIHVPTRKVKVVDTTGAGDAFAAGFLLGLIKNLPLEKCAKVANAVASFSIQKIGARAGLPNRGELASIISLPQ